MLKTSFKALVRFFYPSYGYPPPFRYKTGVLCHSFNRYCSNLSKARIDRLEGILKRGIIAPNYDDSGEVVQNGNNSIIGAKDSCQDVVFVHRFDRYATGIFSNGQTVVLILDEKLEVLDPKDMGPGWLAGSQSEVYVRNFIPPERIKAVIFASGMIEDTVKKHKPRLKELGITVYCSNGECYWSP